MLINPYRETYLTDDEYGGNYGSLDWVRTRIVSNLPVVADGHVLDLLTGHGYFAIEVARCWPNSKVTGIDVSSDDVAAAIDSVQVAGLEDQVDIVKMDSCYMTFPDEHFDMVVNFAGLDEIHGTRGREGVERTIREIARVLKPSSYVSLTVMPPEAMQTMAQRLEVEVFSAICGDTWLSEEEYIHMLDAAGIEHMTTIDYRTGKILTAWQAEHRIRLACERARKIHGLGAMTLERVWRKYGEAIAEHGLGHMSRVLSLVACKRPIDGSDVQGQP